MRSILAVLALLPLAACAGRTLPPVEGSRAHPADPDARTTAFVPAPDPLLSGAHESPPLSPSPAGGVHEGHAGHAGHAAGHGEKHDAPPPPEGAPNQPTVQATTDPVFERYFGISKALVADDFEGATAALDPLRAAADELSHTKDEAVALAADHVRDAVPRDPKAIADLRKNLKALSDAVIALVRKAPPTDLVAPILRLEYCPMADASWLQTEREIQNPYMGQRMPHCGKIVEAIETRAAIGGK